jgi:hypothetical protein
VEVVYHNRRTGGLEGIVKIKRKTRIAVHIDEKLTVRTRQRGDGTVPTSSGSLLDQLIEDRASQLKNRKDLPSCNEE